MTTTTKPSSITCKKCGTAGQVTPVAFPPGLFKLVTRPAKLMDLLTKTPKSGPCRWRGALVVLPGRLKTSEKNIEALRTVGSLFV